jgi:hypothetical protein
MRERTIERYLIDRTKAVGGECRKLKWVGRNAAPDRLVMLNGRTIFVELKAPGEKCRPSQIREHERMRRVGQIVEVVDSFARVDEVLASAMSP